MFYAKITHTTGDLNMPLTHHNMTQPNLTRRHILGLLALPPILALTGGRASAQEPETFQIEGLAIRGYDPVAYFTDRLPVLGKPDHSLNHNGATWRFATAGNLATFTADAEKYGARFGGYCAYAASKGYLAPTIPEAWSVHKDRLYLNASLRVRRLWLRDVPGNIKLGEGNWPAILG
jgi:hypothetical protein